MRILESGTFFDAVDLSTRGAFHLSRASYDIVYDLSQHDVN